MKNIAVSSNGKAALSFCEQELLKVTFDALRPSPESIEEIVAQAKAQSQQK